MKAELLEELKKVTPEEQAILDGKNAINKEIYMSSKEDVIDAAKLLEEGKLIQVRKHTRFIHFPSHTHNYIEVIYMCEGSTRHVIDGRDILLEAGELLFLNQWASQEIYPASENDLAVNFIILPEFFDKSLMMMGEESNLLRDFVVECLKGENGTPMYMHFKVARVLPIQNLLENMIWSIWNKHPNKRSINQVTMGLLFLHLMNYVDCMETNAERREQKLVIDVLGYIEEHYREGELSELAKQLHYDLYWLSKEIKKLTGSNYTELLQQKRLGQAAYLLVHTSLSVLEIGMAVGYENMSYFHRIFYKEYGMTPRQYRMAQK